MYKLGIVIIIFKNFNINRNNFDIYECIVMIYWYDFLKNKFI